ncbi:hypothetical protein BH708_10180 [Brachybacterium sp. P6-10-X1]|uniref:hypothetical protein n=1 Tax=Brachybacterium sp. P6-10-X1 TaxID=1903186 RepID=UPI0009718E2D|nr:hypothetical protein [Brachybacterium sp. P6-10-X1]APX33011.1 hypothetical protein BH708_10180 [Brachybacterium sp. P6-10-X1]
MDAPGTGADDARSGRGSARTSIGVAAVLLSAVGAVWSALLTVLIVLTARVTYDLPPPEGAAEATEHHDWNTPTLAFTAVSGLAFLLALVGLVLGGWGLLRRRGARARVLLCPGAAILLATLAMLLATEVPVPTY